MVRVGFEHLLVILVVAVLGVSCAVQENSQEFPSLLTALGTKMALADDYYDDDDSGKDAAQTPANGCCYPLVWEGFSVHTLSSAPVGGGGRGHRKSGPKVSKSVDQFYVDGSHQRLAGHKRAYFGHHHAVNISWIFSIGANRTGDYYLFDKAAQKCAHRVVRNVAWHRQCLPSNATYHGAFSLGPVGGLNVQLWSFGGRSRSSPAIDGDRHPPPRPRVYFGASMLVVPTTCIPVLVQEHGFVFRGVDQQQEDEFSSRMNIDDTGSLSGEDLHYESYARRRAEEACKPPHCPHPKPSGIGFSGTAYFNNVQTRITDPTVFTVPAYCKKGYPAEDGQEDQSELPTILERFIML